VWWFIFIIPALRRLSQEDDKFVASLGYMGRPCLLPKKVIRFDDLGNSLPNHTAKYNKVNRFAAKKM
jgi:hypothetical protein